MITLCLKGKRTWCRAFLATVARATRSNLDRCQVLFPGRSFAYVSIVTLFAKMYPTFNADEHRDTPGA